MNELVTVIVPVYNVEKYIEKCLSSICGQTYHNLEIIVINDGSEDGSGDICEKYTKQDSRIKVIHQKNQGISVARNVGLERCKGRWITFVDSDDYIEAYMIEELLQLVSLNKSDIGICNWKEVYENDAPNMQPEEKETALISTMTEVEGIKKMLYQDNADCCVWGKLFKAELFQEIRFPVGMLYEDFAVMYQVFGKAKTVTFTEAKGYCYLQRQDSIIRMNYKHKKMDLIKLADDVQKYIAADYPDLKKAVASRVVRANFHIYLQIPVKAGFEEDRRRIEENIRKYRKTVLQDKDAKRGTKIALLLTYFGFDTFLRFKKMTKMGKK